MSNFNIMLFQPNDVIHAHAFLELGKLLFYTLSSMGHQCLFQINSMESNFINIILGYHYLIAEEEQLYHSHPFMNRLMGSRKIYYQLEQLSDHEGWYSKERHNILASADAVWDYTEENASFLREKGIRNVFTVPIGWHAKMETLQHAPCKDIDVLFYGCINPRRQHILAELNRHCRLKVLFGMYGDERDSYIARSKVILNIHFYEAAILEQVRISYLLNNRCFVLSEASPNNVLDGIIETASYEDLVSRCLYFVQHAEAREAARCRGYLAFRQNDMRDFIRPALIPWEG